jgi:hypothetical protein
LVKQEVKLDKSGKIHVASLATADHDLVLGLEQQVFIGIWQALQIVLREQAFIRAKCVG